MYSKRTDSFAITPCWYSREHTPEGRRRRDEDGSLVCTCRYCRKQIRSRGGQGWSLADGLDLDALAASCMSSHFSVVDAFDGIVIARYPLPEGEDPDAVAALEASLREEHGIVPGGDLELRLIRHQDLLDRRH